MMMFFPSAERHGLEVTEEVVIVTDGSLAAGMVVVL